MHDSQTHSRNQTVYHLHENECCDEVDSELVDDLEVESDETDDIEDKFGSIKPSDNRAYQCKLGAYPAGSPYVRRKCPKFNKV